MDNQGAATFDELFEHLYPIIESEYKDELRKTKPGDPNPELDRAKTLLEVFDRFTQLRAIHMQMNKGFVDKETGEIIEGCTPYALQRAKHNLKLISDEAGHNKAIADKVKSTFPLEDWDNFKGDSFEKIDKWIEENNIRPRKPTKNENFA